MGSSPPSAGLSGRYNARDGRAPSGGVASTLVAGVNVRTLGILFAALALAGTAVAGPLGDGIEAVDRGDYATALRLLQPLAEKGDPDAQINLGNMYFDGNGVPQDNAESVKWYLLAAGQGSADAQIALGFLYEYGEAVPQDYVQAHKWFDLAGSGLYRDTLAAKMTPAQIAEAQKLASEWRPKPK
jgi:hypothetical protein